jgi:hypothetical protein
MEVVRMTILSFPDINDYSLNIVDEQVEIRITLVLEAPLSEEIFFKRLEEMALKLLLFEKTENVRQDIISSVFRILSK